MCRNQVNPNPKQGCDTLINMQLQIDLHMVESIHSISGMSPNRNLLQRLHPATTRKDLLNFQAFPLCWNQGPVYKRNKFLVNSVCFVCAVATLL